MNTVPGRPKQAHAPLGGSEPRAAGSVGATSTAPGRPKQARFRLAGQTAGRRVHQ